MICWSLVGQPLGVPTVGLPHCRFSVSTSSGKSVDNSAKGCQKRRLEHFVAAIQANPCLCSSLQGNKLINIANPIKDCVRSNCRSVSSPWAAKEKKKCKLSRGPTADHSIWRSTDLWVLSPTAVSVPSIPLPPLDRLLIQAGPCSAPFVVRCCYCF